MGDSLQDRDFIKWTKGKIINVTSKSQYQAVLVLNHVVLYQCFTVGFLLHAQDSVSAQNQSPSLQPGLASI